MQKILLAFAAGYFVATIMHKSAPVSPATDPPAPTLVEMNPTSLPPVDHVKGIAGTLFPIHRGYTSQLIQI